MYYYCFSEHFGGGAVRLPSESLIDYIGNKHPIDFSDWCDNSDFAHTMLATFILDGCTLNNNGVTISIDTSKDGFRHRLMVAFCAEFFPDFHVAGQQVILIFSPLIYSVDRLQFCKRFSVLPTAPYLWAIFLFWKFQTKRVQTLPRES